MDLDRFWELVEAAAVAGDVDCQAQAERLTAMLEQLAPEEIEYAKPSAEAVARLLAQQDPARRRT